MQMRSVLFAGVSLGAVAPLSAEAATFTKYTDRAAFEAAAGSFAVERFEGYAAGTNIGTGLDFGAFTVAETQFGSFGGGSEIAPGSRQNSIDGTNFLQAELYNGAGNGAYGSFLTLTFDTAITAFGGNWASGSIGNIGIDVLGDAVDRGPGSAGGFFGFVSDTPFTTLVLRSRNGNYGAQLDNLTFSSAAAVPEPASWAMMIAGFGAIGGALRRRPRVVVKTCFA